MKTKKIISTILLCVTLLFCASLVFARGKVEEKAAGVQEQPKLTVWMVSLFTEEYDKVYEGYLREYCEWQERIIYA